MPVDSVSSSLLLRLRTCDPAAWERLTMLYAPVVLDWCRRSNLSSSDAADVVQEVFMAVARGLPTMRRDRPGDTFRGWLATITRNKIRDHYRAVKVRVAATGGTDAQRRLLEATADEVTASFDSSEGNVELQQRGGVIRRAAELVKTEFESTTWAAFWRTAVDGRTPAEIGRELGISVNAVYKARSRVLHRLREELDGIV